MTKYYFVAYRYGVVKGNALLEVTNTSLDGIQDYIASINKFEDRDKIMINFIYSMDKDEFEMLSGDKSK